MKCFYCRKSVNDMQDHLKKNKRCQELHRESLKLQLAEILDINAKQMQNK